MINNGITLCFFLNIAMEAMAHWWLSLLETSIYDGLMDFPWLREMTKGYVECLMNI